MGHGYKRELAIGCRLDMDTPEKYRFPTRRTGALPSNLGSKAGCAWLSEGFPSTNINRNISWFGELPQLGVYEREAAEAEGHLSNLQAITLSTESCDLRYREQHGH